MAFQSKIDVLYGICLLNAYLSIYTIYYMNEWEAARNNDDLVCEEQSLIYTYSTVELARTRY